MDQENVSPTITEPPSVGPSASSVEKRGDNNAVRHGSPLSTPASNLSYSSVIQCRQITFTITNTNIDSPGGSGFPQSCSASLDDSSACT